MRKKREGDSYGYSSFLFHFLNFFFHIYFLIWRMYPCTTCKTTSIFKRIYLFERESKTKRKHVSGGRGRNFPLSMEAEGELNPMTHEIMIWDEIMSWMLNRQNHPGTPIQLQTLLVIKTIRGIVSKLRSGLCTQQLERNKRMNTLSCTHLILKSYFLNNK